MEGRVGREGGWKGGWVGRPLASRVSGCRSDLFLGCTWYRVRAPAPSPAQFRGGDFQAQLQLKRERPRGERLVLGGDSHAV